MADKLSKQTKKMVKNYLPFVKIETQAGKKKGPGPKKEQKPATKHTSKNQEPKTYLEKQEEAKNDGNIENQEPEEPEHVVKRKNLLYLMQLCNKEQIGVIFLLLRTNCPESINYDEDGSVNIQADKIEDKMITRLSELMELWGNSMKNVVFTTGGRRK